MSEPIESEDPGFWISLRDSLLRPKAFFASLNPMGPWGTALLFAVLTTLIAAIGMALDDYLFPQKGNALFEALPWYWDLFDWPIYLVLEFLYLFWFHQILKWRGGTAYPYRASFRAYCYTGAATVFYLIPVAGMWIALAWGFFLIFYSLKTLQKTTWTRVITSWLIANAVLGLGLFLLIFAAGYFRHYFS
ncbi:MAG: YIP1 family protein [Deltaproteobacteria bacterium]|nr:YIP1 family protein [Deltaproteobacteria bacterium]